MAAPIPRVPPVTIATRDIFLTSILLARAFSGAGRPQQENAPARNAAGARNVVRSAFDGQRNAHAAADAQSRETFFGVAATHFMQKGNEDTGARGAYRMADGDGAAVDVDLGRVPAKLAVDRNG